MLRLVGCSGVVGVYCAACWALRGCRFLELEDCCNADESVKEGGVSLLLLHSTDSSTLSTRFSAKCGNRPLLLLLLPHDMVDIFIPEPRHWILSELTLLFW